MGLVMKKDKQALIPVNLDYKGYSNWVEHLATSFLTRRESVFITQKREEAYLYVRRDQAFSDSELQQELTTPAFI